MNAESSSHPRKNIELKARIRSLDAAREIAAVLATAPPETQHQVDTYFHCRHGRLKLREIVGRRAELIWYERPNDAEAKASEYGLLAVAEPAEMKRALAAALGVRAVVDKQREIFLHHNVRIHLDRVAGLGEFLEFEAVLSDGIDAARGQAQVAELQRRFGIAAADLLTGSYGEMIAAAVPE